MRILFKLLLMMAVLLSSCADRFSREKVEMTLAKGNTTKKEVRAFFGEPSGKYINPGMKITSGGIDRVVHGPFEVWLYSQHEMRLADLFETESLRIVFNDDGIVSNYEYFDDGD